MRESTTDVIACVSASIALFSASLIPWLLLVEAEHLVPRRVRELPATARETGRRVALTVAAFLLICTPSNGAAS